MSRALFLFAALLLLVALASAQEINIAIGLGGRPAPKTIFEEIDDRARAAGVPRSCGTRRRARRSISRPATWSSIRARSCCAKRTNWLRVRTSRKAISLAA